tara:strand:+ start:2227 stop:2613 length:387 start_codon:yes stop_codon:yes gene_type:complete
MEEQFKNIDRLTEKLVKDAGLDKPSTNFLNDVMSAVNQTAIKQEYKPLISKPTWFIIGALFVASFVALYFYSSPELSLLQDLNLFEKLSFKMPVSEFQVPKTMVYAIGCLGLFLFQIPFLKNYLKTND